MKEYLELQDNEFRFSSIIGKSDTDFPIFYNHFKNRDKLSFLNLGCQVPLIQFVAYHVFNFDTFIAIDTDSEYNCVKNFVGNIKSWEAEKQREALLWKTFFDVYTSLVIPDSTEKPKITTKIEFDKVFLKDFQNTDIRNYLSNETRKFDLIDTSNILHFFWNKRELKNIISKISNLLKRDGVLHISVNTNYPDFDIPFFKKLIKNSVKEGYFIICKKDNCTETHFLNVAYK
jgi:SAM-dependent methyltransferase